MNFDKEINFKNEDLNINTLKNEDLKHEKDKEDKEINEDLKDFMDSKNNEKDLKNILDDEIDNWIYITSENKENDNNFSADVETQNSKKENYIFNNCIELNKSIDENRNNNALYTYTKMIADTALTYFHDYDYDKR